MSTHLEMLGTEECLRLLEAGAVGRVGVTVSGVPEVLPVNYRVIDGNVVFRTGSGTKLHAATRHAPIAFEVDESDPETLAGWSVLVVGFSEEVTDPGEVAQALGMLPNGWVAGDREHVVRLTPSRISGRRLRRG